MCEVTINIVQTAQLMLVIPMQVALKNVDFQRYQKDIVAGINTKAIAFNFLRDISIEQHI